MSGEPSYIELGVTDVAAAKEFYGSLLGWTVSDVPGGASVSTDSIDIGIHGGDSASHFEVFFVVPDLAASLGRIAELGGSTIGEVNDAGDFGRWVECRDNQGVRFGLREQA